MANDDPPNPAEGTERNIAERAAEDVSTFTAVTNDFYRGEIDRTTTWRARLDQTTNWAVVLVAAILTWAFSSPENPHYVILIGVFGATAFLLMEANRYREYDIWRERVRTLQENFFAAVYAPDHAPEKGWQSTLSEELQNPAFEISFQQALTHRLRRSYLPLLLILLAAWIARITVYEPQETWQQTASILVIPGTIVTATVGTFYVLLIALTIWSARDSRVREFQE